MPSRSRPGPVCRSSSSASSRPYAKEARVKDILAAIDKVAKPTRRHERSYRGFNLFLGEDHRLFLTLARGQWSISGFRAADLRAHMPALSPARSSHLLKRLRLHGLIKKVGHRYKHYLTTFGRRVVATTLTMRELVVVPSLCCA